MLFTITTLRKLPSLMMTMPSRISAICKVFCVLFGLVLGATTAAGRPALEVTGWADGVTATPAGGGGGSGAAADGETNGAAADGAAGFGPGKG